MKSMVIPTRAGGPPEVISTVEVARPAPGPGEVLVEVRAAVVNPIDLMTRSGGTHALGWIAAEGAVGLGWDLAGRVDALGEGAEQANPRLTPGAKVAGISFGVDKRTGAYAQYVVVPAEDLAVLADDADPVQAATVPLNSLSAAQSLDLAGEPGDTLLVTGAAGAVGGYTIPLARQRGWRRIVALARPGDEDFLRQAGADDVITSLDAVSAPVDAVVDTAGIGAAAVEKVRDDGVYVAAGPPMLPTIERPVRGEALVAGSDARLQELVDWALSGEVAVRVADTLPLDRAADAHRRLEAGGVRGRLVLVP